MASLTQIRKALKNTIDNHTTAELFVYDLVEDLGQLPAVIIEPTSSEFEEAMNRGLDCWYFNLYILVSPAADSANGQSLLDQLISGAGPNSIRELLFNRPDLGLSNTDASVLGMKDYGGKLEWASIQHVGAILKVRVLTDGRA